MRKSIVSALVFAVAAITLASGQRRRRNEAGADLRANLNGFALPILTGPRTKSNSLIFWPSA